MIEIRLQFARMLYLGLVTLEISLRDANKLLSISIVSNTGPVQCVYHVNLQLRTLAVLGHEIVFFSYTSGFNAKQLSSLCNPCKAVFSAAGEYCVPYNHHSDPEHLVIQLFCFGKALHR